MSVHNFYSDEGEELVSERIKSYFDAAPLFKWGGQLGSGANGIVYKVFNQVDGKLRTFAVKIAPIDVDLGGNKSWGEDDEPVPDEVQSLESEKLWLSVRIYPFRHPTPTPSRIIFNLSSNAN